MSSGCIKEHTMPYQNLDSEIMLAVAMWLLAILIFVSMLVVAFLEVVAEYKAKRKLDLKTSPLGWAYLFQSALRIIQRRKEH
jgi:hypothetical protein